MANIAIIIGRMTKDPEIRYTQAGNAWGSFSVAVDNPGKDKGASFPTCKCFGETAQTVEKWGAKGRLVAITGHIQTGSYTNKKGEKVYTTDVIVDRIEFLDRKSEAVPDETDKASAQAVIPGFEFTDEDIPF